MKLLLYLSILCYVWLSFMYRLHNWRILIWFLSGSRWKPPSDGSRLRRAGFAVGPMRARICFLAGHVLWTRWSGGVTVAIARWPPSLHWKSTPSQGGTASAEGCVANLVAWLGYSENIESGSTRFARTRNIECDRLSKSGNVSDRWDPGDIPFPPARRTVS